MMESKLRKNSMSLTKRANNRPRRLNRRSEMKANK